MGCFLWLTRINYGPNLFSDGFVVKFAFWLLTWAIKSQVSFQFQRVFLVHITRSETWTQDLQLSLQHISSGSTWVGFYGPGLYNSLCFIYLLYYLLILFLFGHSVGVLTCLVWLISVFISFACWQILCDLDWNGNKALDLASSGFNCLDN